MILEPKVSFPQDRIDPRKKGRDWCLQYTRAAWSEWNRSGLQIFNRGSVAEGRFNYDTIADFMEGNQDVKDYYPLMGVDENSDDTWMNLDWSILPVMPKYVRVVNGILDKLQYKVGFVPLDSTATDRRDTHFANVKAKMLMREEILSAAGPEGPDIIKQLGLDKLSEEPGDMEELEMQMTTTWKDTVAIEWTKDVAAVLSANNIDALRKYVRRSVLYYGVGGYKDYIDSNGSIKIRAVDPRGLITSWCKERDFSDARYIGEVILMSIEDIAQSNQAISMKDLERAANEARGKYGNPAGYGNWGEMSQFKVQVLDLEWASVDEHNYHVDTTKYGNMAVVKQPINRSGDGYVRDRFKMLYKAKWIIGTEVIWDYGQCNDIKRAKEQMSDIMPNYHLVAPMISNMKIQSIGITVQPILNQVQVAWLRLQKTIGEYRSKGISINLSSVEGVNLGKGGENMTPMEIMDLFFQGNIHLYRMEDGYDPSSARKQEPIRIVEGTGMSDVLDWFNAIRMYIQMLSDAIGLNEFTDASTPDARALTATVNTANMATNNSLNDIVETDVALLSSLSKSVVVRLQDMIEMGLGDNVSLAIGSGSVDFLKKNPKVAPADWAIEIRRLPSEEERQQMIAEAKSMMGAEMLAYEDVVLIKTIDNLAEAEKILAYRVKKRRAEKMKESMMLQQQNAEVQTQSAIAAEEARQKTEQVKGNIDIEVAKIQAAASIKVAEIQAGSSVAGRMISTETKSEPQVA